MLDCKSKERSGGMEIQRKDKKQHLIDWTLAVLLNTDSTILITRSSCLILIATFLFSNV